MAATRPLALLPTGWHVCLADAMSNFECEKATSEFCIINGGTIGVSQNRPVKVSLCLRDGGGNSTDCL